MTPIAKTSAIIVLTIIVAVAVFLILLVATCHGAQPTLPQGQLEPIIEQVPYGNTLFIDPHEPGYLGKLDAKTRLFRCGEVVRIKANPKQEAIILDYQFKNGQWFYKLLAK